MSLSFFLFYGGGWFWPGGFFGPGPAARVPGGEGRRGGQDSPAGRVMTPAVASLLVYADTVLVTVPIQNIRFWSWLPACRAVAYLIPKSPISLMGLCAAWYAVFWLRP